MSILPLHVPMYLWNLLPVSVWWRLVLSLMTSRLRGSKPIRRPNLEDVNRRLRYYYFRFVKANGNQIGILLSVSIPTYLSSYVCHFASAYQISSESDHWRCTGIVMTSYRFLPRCVKRRRGLPMRIMSVRLSVCLSVCQTRVLWQNGKEICPDFYTIQKII